MQLMTWPLARLGSRFGLLFEPQRRRIMHSALGRFLDQPLDLAVGLIEPDGTERLMPFTPTGSTLYGPEQFERINSITYRGHSEHTGIRFEVNFHSPFYPQDERLCLLPVIYVELRVTHAPRIRSRRHPITSAPDNVRLFFRMNRPGTRIDAAPGRIDMTYEVPLTPRYEPACGIDDEHEAAPSGGAGGTARVFERIHSLNDAATWVIDQQGRAGLTLELPVTEEGSGIKWRLVWGAHTADPVLNIHGQPAPLRYVRHWRDLDAVMREAIANRDENLALSRRFEKLLEQAPLDRAQWHLLVLSFQTYLANTFWCQRADGRDFFSVWGGCSLTHNPVTAVYHECLMLLSLWPRLLKLSLEEWTEHCADHAPSGGLTASPDLGIGMAVVRGRQSRHRTLDINSDLLLLLQAYAHWTGDTELLSRHAKMVDRLAAYLLWADREGTGFPPDSPTMDLNGETMSVSTPRRHTWLAIKRMSAMEAAADLLQRAGEAIPSERYRTAARHAVAAIERQAWLDDHYGYAPGPAKAQLLEPGDGIVDATGWSDYTVQTAHGLMLPTIIAQPLSLESDRLRSDMLSGYRETLRNYGCTDVSSDISRLSISGNIWRDQLARYLHINLPPTDSRYWDLQVYSNTEGQSLSFCDSYIADELAFSPRGVATFGYFLAGPRLQLDRLDGEYVSVDPDRGHTQRWPLLPLADWPAGKIPICYVDTEGRVRIEGRIQPVKIAGEAVMKDDTIG